MKALTIKQPWADRVIFGTKRVENRTWKPPDWMIGKQIAIHAGKALDGPYEPGETNTGIRGAVIGVAKIARIVQPNEKKHGLDRTQLREWWDPHQFGWVLKDVWAIETPLFIRGALGLWDFNFDIRSVYNPNSTFERWAFAGFIDAKDDK